MLSRQLTSKQTYPPRRRLALAFGLLALISFILSRLPPGSTPSHPSRRRSNARELLAAVLSTVAARAVSAKARLAGIVAFAAARATATFAPSPSANHTEHRMHILPPPFTPLLTALIGDPRLSAALFRSYARLYAAAWPYAYECTAALDFESQVVALLGVSRSQARLHLRQLRQNGLLSWSSDGSHGYIFRFSAPQLSIYPGPHAQPIYAELPSPGRDTVAPASLAPDGAASPNPAAASRPTDAPGVLSRSYASAQPDYGGVGINPYNYPDRVIQQHTDSAKTYGTLAAVQNAPADRQAPPVSPPDAAGAQRAHAAAGVTGTSAAPGASSAPGGETTSSGKQSLAQNAHATQTAPHNPQAASVASPGAAPDPQYTQALNFLRRAGVWSKIAVRLAQQIAANEHSDDPELPGLGDLLGWTAYCFSDREKNRVSNPAAVLAANLTNNLPCPPEYRPPLICTHCQRSQKYCRCQSGKAQYSYPPEFLTVALKNVNKYSAYSDRWGVCMYCHAVPCQCEEE